MTETTKAAFVTGSGRNIGRAIALELARRGMNVVVHGFSNPAQVDAVCEQVRAFGVEAHAAIGDLSHTTSVEAIAASAIERFGGIHVLVNNAAIRPAGAIDALSDDDWHHVFNVNVHSAFKLIKAVLPAMQSSRWGRIVNFAGMNAIHGYNGRAHVSASKHAVWGLTKALAKELGPLGITVNAISPGPIATEHPENPDMVHHIEQMVSRIPLARLGRPEEVAALCGFLCSHDGGFVSGQMLAVNGAGET